jgi:hypothetical protein
VPDRASSKKTLSRAAQLRRAQSEDMFTLPEEQAELVGKKLTLAGLVDDG